MYILKSSLWLQYGEGNGAAGGEVGEDIKKKHHDLNVFTASAFFLLYTSNPVCQI